MSWLTRALNAFKGGRSEADLDEELQFHFDERVHGLMHSGMARQDAELKARRELGNTTQLRESIHAARTATHLESLLSDIRFGFRMLLKSKAAALTAIASLGIAIGACTIAFTVIDALILRPLPVNAPAQLVDLSSIVPAFASPANKPRQSQTFSYPLFQLMRGAVRNQAELFAIGFRASFWSTVDNSDTREKLRFESIDGDGLRILGVKPAIGRILQPQDDSASTDNPAAVISDSFWKRRFGGAPDVIGRSITLGKARYTIVGVLEDRFTSLAPGYIEDVWLPLSVMAGTKAVANPDASFAIILGRLRPGVTAAQLQQPLQVVFSNFIKERVQIHPLGTTQQTQIQQYLAMPLLVQDASAGEDSLFRLQLRRPLWMVALVCSLLLLLACSNVATLSLARASARASEMGLRTSLGAARFRLMQQLLVESAQIAGSACLLGLAFASLASPWIVTHLGPTDFPAWLDVTLNLRTFAFAAGTSVLTVILFGVLPALHASSVSPASLLRSGQSQISGRMGILRWALTTQIAFSVALLFLSGLLVISFRKISTFDLGFVKDNIVLFDLQRRDSPDLPLADSGESLLSHLRSAPGVQAASISVQRPMGGDMAWIMQPIVRFRGNENETVRPREVSVSRGFFSAMGVHWISGRDFLPEEMAGASTSVIVNQAFVDKFRPGQIPLGQTFTKLTDDPKPQVQQIVGVVGNFRYNNIREAEEPSIYTPLRQINGTTLNIRTTTNPAAIIPSLRREIAAAGPNLTVSGDLLLETQIDNILISERLLAWQAGFFSIVSLLLAGVGLYGVLSYVSVRRSREIGIRIALGARPAEVVRLIAHETTVPVLVGVVVGTACGFGLARFLESQLFRVAPTDVAILAIPIALILFTAVIATIRPALVAVSTDPLIVLRSN